VSHFSDRSSGYSVPEGLMALNKMRERTRDAAVILISQYRDTLPRGLI
jgi:hypothetical protein